jgi:hypothetical protein
MTCTGPHPGARGRARVCGAGHRVRRETGESREREHRMRTGRGLIQLGGQAQPLGVRRGSRSTRSGPRVWQAQSLWLGSIRS